MSAETSVREHVGTSAEPDRKSISTIGQDVSAIREHDGNSDRWLTQSRVHAPELGIQGDCTRAAVASFFGLDMIDVPDFNAGDSYAWHKGMEAFFASRGYELLRFDSHRRFKGYYLAGGPSPRGVKHMVIMRDGMIVHDPHMSRAGLRAIEHVWVPVPFDPATRLVSMPAELDHLSHDATGGEWFVTEEDVDGSYGGGPNCGSGWTGYALRTKAEQHYGKSASILDSVNSEVGVIQEEHDEDGARAWDEPARANTTYVAALVNWHRDVLGLREAIAARPDSTGGGAP